MGAAVQTSLSLYIDRGFVSMAAGPWRDCGWRSLQSPYWSPCGHCSPSLSNCLPLSSRFSLLRVQSKESRVQGASTLSKLCWESLFTEKLGEEHPPKAKRAAAKQTLLRRCLFYSTRIPEQRETSGSSRSIEALWKSEPLPACLRVVQSFCKRSAQGTRW